MPYLIFALLYLYTANWQLVHKLLKASQAKKNEDKSVLRTKDKKLVELIYQRTHGRAAHIYLIPSEKLFAYGGGIAKKPLLFLSTGAYKTFSGDALEWLLLHEMGHIMYNHSIGISIVQLSYLIIGIVLLGMVHSGVLFVAVLLLSIGLGIAAIQTNKEFDYLANAYAVKRMNNPLGMKQGALLLMKQVQDQGIHEDTLAMKLFYPWNYGLWYETIHAAENEIERRKNSLSR